MKRNLISFGLLSVLLCFISCSKDDTDNNPGTGTTSLIKTSQIKFDTVFDFGTRTYTYNSNKQIKSIVSSLSNWSNTYEYTATEIREVNDQIFEKHYSTYFLKDGLVDSAVTDDEFARHKYYYDNNSYLIKAITYDELDEITEIVSYTISNGNIVLVEIKDENDVIVRSFSFSEFDSAHNNTIGNANKGTPFLGKSSVHLAKKIAENDGGATSEITLVPVYDASGRIIKVTEYVDSVYEGDQIYTYY